MSKSSIYTAKVNPLIITLPLVKILGSKEKSVNLINLRNFLSKKCYIWAACFSL